MNGSKVTRGGLSCGAELPSGDRTCELWHAVSDLPPANRDTLAALVVHLQVVANSAEALMPIENLVRVFAPILVGYSSTHVASVADIQGKPAHRHR